MLRSGTVYRVVILDSTGVRVGREDVRFFPRSYDTLDNKWSGKLDVVTSLMTVV